MRATVLRLWQYARTPEGLKLVRYTMVSVISALTSLVILTIVFGVLRLWSEVFSAFFANVMAGIPSYFLNRQWVWKKSGRSHLWREILPFWVMSITGIVLALFTAQWAHNFATAHHLHHFARTVLVVGANIAAFGILWFLKFLILNRLFAQIAEAELHDGAALDEDDDVSGATNRASATTEAPSRADPPPMTRAAWLRRGQEG